MADVVFTASASRQWLKLAPQTRELIGAKLEAFARTGRGDIEKLKGQDGSRLRVGDWRIIFYQESQSFVVVAVGHRREIYVSAEPVKVRFKDTPKGEVAILPRAEYERLKAIADESAEDAGTARLVANAKRDVAGDAPLLPLAVVKRLAAGENPVRVLRQFRGMTQTELAAADSVRITQNYLSDIETGRRKGPFELHRKIAMCLGVPFDLLAPIAVTAQDADPKRYEKRPQVIAAVKRSRGQR